MEIDMVFTYVSSTKPDFNIRYSDIGEISFSVKSVLKFIPWIRNIYVITDKQDVPKDISDKVILIDHADIIPTIYRPTYNSDTIESYIHNIKGLSEIFLYNNDDVCHLDYVNRTDIYDDDLRLNINSKFDLDILKTKTTEYSKRLCLTSKLLHNIYPDIKLINNHHTKILRKTTLKLIESGFKEELVKMRESKYRNDNYIQYLFLALNVDNFYYKNNINTTNNVIEVHLGSKPYVDGFFDKFKRTKFACFNSMDYSYKHAYEAFMNNILNEHSEFPLIIKHIDFSRA